jgi:hypothetical protein
MVTFWLISTSECELIAHFKHVLKQSIQGRKHKPSTKIVDGNEMML